MDWCPYGKASSGTKRRYICEPLREHHSNSLGIAPEGPSEVILLRDRQRESQKTPPSGLCLSIPLHLPDTVIFPEIAPGILGGWSLEGTHLAIPTQQSPGGSMCRRLVA